MQPDWANRPTEGHMGFLTGRRSGGCLGRLLVVGISLAAAAQSQSVTAEAHSESEIKSAMLYNFAKFVEWPEGALGGAGTPLVAGVVGDTVMVSALEETLRNRTVDGHPLRVRRLSSAADLKICAILLVGSSDRTEIAKILQCRRTAAHSDDRRRQRVFAPGRHHRVRAGGQPGALRDQPGCRRARPFPGQFQAAAISDDLARKFHGRAELTCRPSGMFRLNGS